MKRGKKVSGRSPKNKLEDTILHNLIELQKVHTSLAEKFDSLSKQINSLLNLFELSARAFAKQAPMQAIEKDREFLDKIDKLLEQNKTIAKGLTLMEEKMRERIYGSPSSSFPQQPPFQQPQFANQ